MSVSELNRNPFVKQMGDGPVCWHLWSEETIKKARDLDRPVCLCILNSKSRWSRETKKHFNNSEIARMLNNDFISVIADSDDVPQLTLAARVMAQLMMGHSGWPLFIFMTPEKKPVFASSYMPEQSNDPRMPGLLEVLRRIKWLWLMKRSQISEAAESYGAQLAETLKPYTAALHCRPEDNAAAQLLDEEDHASGGIGTAPKFPQASKLRLAAYLYENEVQKDKMEHLVKNALSAFFKNGLYDHIGGGFHDYCFDSCWKQPCLGRHIGQNAAVLSVYVEAYRLFHIPLYSYLVRKSISSLMGSFDCGNNLLYSGDNIEDTENICDYYLWNRNEIERVLGDRSDAFCNAYNIGSDKNYTDPVTQSITGKSIPMPSSLFDITTESEQSFISWTANYAQDLASLESARNERRPEAEKKISVRENALFAGILAKASSVLAQKNYYSCAEKIMTALLQKTVSEGILCHALYDNVRDGLAVLDDAAAVVWGCLELYKAGHSSEWLEKTKEWCRKTNELFGDEGAYRLVPLGTSEILPAWDAGDDYLPSGNGIMADCLLTLNELTAEPVWKLRAREVIHAFGGALNEYPAACASLMIAALRLRKSEGTDVSKE